MMRGEDGRSGMVAFMEFKKAGDSLWHCKDALRGKRECRTALRASESEPRGFVRIKAPYQAGVSSRCASAAFYADPSRAPSQPLVKNNQAKVNRLLSQMIDIPAEKTSTAVVQAPHVLLSFPEAQ